MAAGNLARPVVAEAHALQLRAHRRYVVAGPVGGMDLGVDRGILGRQPEGIPPHRVEDVEALRPAVAGDEIAHRVITDMPDMELARRVWEHFKNIIFRPRRVLTRLETPALAPLALPFRLGFPKIVTRHARSHSGAPSLEWLARRLFIHGIAVTLGVDLPRPLQNGVFQPGDDIPRDRRVVPLLNGRVRLA